VGQKRFDPNTLAIRIQPDEGISLKINCKVPGPAGPIQPVKMDFRYGSYFGTAPPEAYERLICDALLGDSTLFAREDEVLASWGFLTPTLERWAKETPKNFPNYAAGTWGPKEADDLIAKEGRKWRVI
jgi:glucose-6-phosphate 1-dehydrogenase